MVGEQALQVAEATFVNELYARARRLRIPIDQTLWEYHAAAGVAEVTVVSNGKAYIVSLHPADFPDSPGAAGRRDIVELILGAIRDNGPTLQGRK